MKQMKVEQLFVEGKYMVIYLSPETAVYDEMGYYLWNKEGKDWSLPKTIIPLACLQTTNLKTSLWSLQTLRNTIKILILGKFWRDLQWKMLAY
jgi:hypothetical protein